MKKYIVIAGIVAATLGASSVYSTSDVQAEQLEFILQGAKKATMINNVKEVGGLVVHEYSVIDAVSVKLTSSQLEALKQLNPMVRSFEGQNVKVSSVINAFSSENMRFNLKKQTAIWRGINESNETVLVDAINLNMPNANQRIKFVAVNGKRLSAKRIKLNGSIALNESEQFSLGAGQVVKVKIKFKRINTTDANDYSISFSETMEHSDHPNTSDSTADASANDSADSSKTIAGKVVFDSTDNKASWTIANASDYAKEIASLSFTYPQQNISINGLSIDGIATKFTEGETQELALATPFILGSGSSVDISATYQVLSSAYSDDYQLVVNYNHEQSESVVVPLNHKTNGVNRDTHYPTLVNANLAHQRGLTGYGVTVAIIDTGIRDLQEIKKTATNGNRDITIVDVLGTSKNKGQAKRNDFNGHGTHLASIIVNSSESYDATGTPTGSYNGIAPDANLLVLKAFDEQGHSSYTAILQALEYAVEYKDIHNIKVLNLSFSALPSSYYWDDPLNQALMKAWQSGITVVAAAGNRGSDAMTIGVPGNTPYVITVGAVSDNYTPSNLNDDFVTTFSSAGPTLEGFVKPELVAPGGRIQGVMDKKTLIRETYALYSDKDSNAHNYFEMSGTSQSTAVTSGVIALMLQANPNLSPDDVKCRLIETAKVATNAEGELAFSVFQQGAGLVDAIAAIDSTAMNCSNTGLSIAKDISGEEHFIGPVRFEESKGGFHIPGIEGLEWSGVYSDSQLWRNAAFSSDSQLWRNASFSSDSQLWRNTAFSSNSQLWRNAAFSADSQLWRNAAFSADSQLWRNAAFSSDSQLWRNAAFSADSQLWRNAAFSADSISREWVNHE